MKPHLRKAGLLESLLEPAGEPGWVKWVPILATEHQPPFVAHPGRTKRKPLLELPSSMRLEFVDKRHRSREGPPAAIGLRRAEVIRTVVALERASHMDQPGTKVDIIPGQSAQLALTQPETQSDGIESTVAILRD